MAHMMERGTFRVEASPVCWGRRTLYKIQMKGKLRHGWKSSLDSSKERFMLKVSFKKKKNCSLIRHLLCLLRVNSKDFLWKIQTKNGQDLVEKP